MEEFFTRQRASEGVRLPLSLPDGTPSEHWFQVRGIDSDEFRAAESVGKRKAIELAMIDSEQERAEKARDAELHVIASLISEWSFPQPCTEEEKVKFLREAPQIADAVNRFAARRVNFFAKKPEDSSSGLKLNSSSSDQPQKDQK